MFYDSVVSLSGSTDIPSAAPTAPAASVAGETDHSTEIRPRRSRSSAMPAYDHEAIVPAQWFADRPLQPEKRLMLAVLADAFDLLLRPPAPAHSRRLPWQRDAARWLRSDDREWPYSFVNICEVLSLEPHRVRERLQRCIEQRRMTRETCERPPSEPTAACEPDAIDDPGTRCSSESPYDPIDACALSPAESLPEIPPAYPYPQPWF